MRAKSFQGEILNIINQLAKSLRSFKLHEGLIKYEQYIKKKKGTNTKKGFKNI